MRFESQLVEGTLIRRYNRYWADVTLQSGDEITAHCANPAKLDELANPGNRVLLSVTDNPRRKFKHQLEIIYSGDIPVGVHNGRPRTLVFEGLTEGTIPQLAGYAKLERRLKTQGETRIDFVLSGNGLRDCYVVVENVCTAKDDVAFFPDCLNNTGVAQSAYLTDLVREGKRGMVIFVVQRSDVGRLVIAPHADHAYAQAIGDAAARGVEIVAMRTAVKPDGLHLDRQLDVEIPEVK